MPYDQDGINPNSTNVPTGGPVDYRVPSAGVGGSFDGSLFDRGGFAYNIKSTKYGGNGNCQGVADGAMTSGSNVLASATGFPNAAPGQAIGAAGCGAAGAGLVTTIQSVTNLNTLVLNANAGAGGPFNGKAVRWGFDNSGPSAALVAAAGVGGTLVYPSGNYAHATTGIQPLDRQAVLGAGSGFTTITPMGPVAAGAGDGIRLAAAAGAAYFNGLSLFDLVVDGACQPGASSGVTVVGVHNFVAERLQIKSTGNFGMYLTSISAGGVLGLGPRLLDARVRDTFITGSRLNDNFGGGGLEGPVFDRCWSDTPITNGFDHTNLFDAWYIVCRVTATTGTPSGFASDFGSVGVHYVDCIARGAGIQNGFVMTDDHLNAAAQGACSRIFYRGCHVIGIANLPFWFKAVAATDGINGVSMDDCWVDSTAAAGVYAQGVNHLSIRGGALLVGAAKYGVSLDASPGAGPACANVVILTDLTGTLGVQQLAAATGVNTIQDQLGNLSLPGNIVSLAATPRIWGGATDWGVRNHAGTLDNLSVADAGDVFVPRGNLHVTLGGVYIDAGGVQVAGGQGLDTEAAGLLKVGAGNATSTTLGKSNPGTGATTGFPYVPASAGVPTGVATAQAGYVPVYYDTTTHKIWFYDAGWKGVVVA